MNRTVEVSGLPQAQGLAVEDTLGVAELPFPDDLFSRHVGNHQAADGDLDIRVLFDILLVKLDVRPGRIA